MKCKLIFISIVFEDDFVRICPYYFDNVFKRNLFFNLHNNFQIDIFFGLRFSAL